MIKLRFRDNAALIFIISALLLPSIIISRELVVVGGCIALFVLVQITLLYLFYRQQEHGFEEWHAFWAVITGLFFVLAVVLLGRGLQMEYIGFLLFICYFISIVIFVFKDDMINIWARARAGLARASPSASGAEVSEDDIKEFRGKDDLDRLIDEFEIPEPRKSYPDKTENSFSEIKDDGKKQEPYFTAGAGARTANQAQEQSEITDYDPLPEEEKSYSFHDEDAETYVVNMIKARREEKEKEGRIADELPSFKDYFTTEHSYSDEEEDVDHGRDELLADKPQIRALKETPRIDFGKVKENMEEIDSGIKTISDKIREISEKAIKEGEEKKRKAIERAASSHVFASTTGNKYHNDKGCVALKRVAKKNIKILADSVLARKKGLKACGLCRK